MLYVGVDLGGTNIKVALVNGKNEILAEKNKPTNLPRTPEAVCDDIVLAIQELLEEQKVPVKEIAGIGVGCPGMVDDVQGVVHYSNNLDWHNFALCNYIEEKIGIRPALGNDANVAALGEAVAGSAKGTQSAVIITLGMSCPRFLVQKQC